MVDEIQPRPLRQLFLIPPTHTNREPVDTYTPAVRPTSCRRGGRGRKRDGPLKPLTGCRSAAAHSKEASRSAVRHRCGPMIMTIAGGLTGTRKERGERSRSGGLPACAWVVEWRRSVCEGAWLELAVCVGWLNRYCSAACVCEHLMLASTIIALLRSSSSSVTASAYRIEPAQIDLAGQEGGHKATHPTVPHPSWRACVRLGTQTQQEQEQCRSRRSDPFFGS